MPFVSSNEWQFLVTSLAGTVLADVSEHVLDATVSPRLSVPSLQQWTVPLTPAVLALPAGDGYPLFYAGLRRGVAIRNGVVVANDKLWRTKPAGGTSSGYLTCELVGPMIRWETRFCQDANGQIFDGPSADGTDRGMDLPAGIVANPALEVGAGELLRQALANTLANDGPMEITLGGPFSSIPAPGEAFVFSVRNRSPLRISELATMFREMGVCDILVSPLGPGSEAAGSVSAVDRAGVDRPNLSFDYGTGQNNVAWAYPETDMDEFCNKLWYELGLREGSHFGNNVTRDAPGVTVDDIASRALYGVYHDIVEHPNWLAKIPSSSDLYKMYVVNYNAELAARIAQRVIVRVVPQPGLAPEPWDAYGLGDTPRLNLAQLGMDVSGASFRVIGWDTTVERGGRDSTQLLIGWAPE